MALHQPPKFKRKNKLTGIWEWVTPEPVDLAKTDGMKPINVRENKSKKSSHDPYRRKK